MIYRVVYKRVLVSTGQVAMVEEDLEADYFALEDGALVFYSRPDHAFKAIPAGAWAGIEPVSPSEQSSILKP